MSRNFPEMPILGLVDWYGCPFLFLSLHQIHNLCLYAIFKFQNFQRNPAGLAILCTFKFGSIGMGLEAYRYGALPTVILVDFQALYICINLINRYLIIVVTQLAMLSGLDCERMILSLYLTNHISHSSHGICRLPKA